MRGPARPAVLVAALCLGFAATAQAKTIDVHPGPNTINNAIAHAHNGDTLAIHRGTYGKAVLVDKRLTLEAAGHARPVINAGCGSENAIDMAHAGIVLDHLKVTGGSSHTVNIANQPSGRIRDVVVRNTCNALYGINLSATGHIDVDGNRASGYQDSGVYVGEITDTAGGTLRVRNNDLGDNDRGVIIEDSVRSTQIVVSDNILHDNMGSSFIPAELGAYVLNSDGVLFRGNAAADNGQFGFFVDSNSGHNRFIANAARGNGTGAFHDEGPANCGSHNSFSIPAC